MNVAAVSFSSPPASARIELAASEREEDADTTSAVKQTPAQENRGRTLPITLEPARVGEGIDTFA